MRVFIKRLFGFCIILFSGYSALQAQDSCRISFTGKVLDVDHKEVLQGAIIYIDELQKWAKTDEKGIFSFNDICAGKYKVRCTYIGYDTVESVVDLTSSVTNHTFRLHTDEHLLHEVIVSGQRKEEHSSLSKITLDEKQLAQNTGKSLGETLKNIEGVTTLQTGASISKPVIHGLHSQRILILNNGIRQEGQQWGTEHAPEIDPTFATEISVVKGANTVRYGPDALGGVILLSPKPLLQVQGLGGDVSLFGSSNNGLFGTSATVEGKTGKSFYLRAHGLGKKAGSSRTPGYYLKNTGYEEAAGSLSAAYVNDKFNTEIFYSRYNTKLGIYSGAHIGNLTDLQRAFESNVPLEKSDFSYQIARSYQAIQHDLLKLSSNFYIAPSRKMALVYGFQNNNRSEYDKHRPLNDSLAGFNRPELNYKIFTHTADITYEQAFKKNLLTTFGISGMWQQNNYSGRFFIPNFQNRGAGIFSVMQWHKNKMQLEAGLRYDVRQLNCFFWENNVLKTPEHQYSNISGSAGINYEFSHHWNIGFNSGMAWRPPSPNELYSKGLHHGAASIEYGNSKLQTERALNNILNLHYWYNKYFDVHLTAYANYINNYIYLAPKVPAELTIRGAFPAFEHKQAKALISGSDINIEWHSRERLLLNVKGMFLYGQNLSASEPLMLMPANRVNTVLEYRIKSARLKDAFIRGGVQHVWAQTRVPENADYVAPPKGYWLATISAGAVVKFHKQPVEINLEVENVTNTIYRDYLNRLRYFTNEPGRNISLRLKMPFGKLKSNYTDL